MNWNYRCPKCDVMLNPDETVILIASRGDTRVIVGMNPEPGSYGVFFPPEVEPVKGEQWEFVCPACHQDLTMSHEELEAKDAPDEKLCALNLVDDEGTHQVAFSKVIGQKATVVVSGGAIRSEHGMDLTDFLYYTSIFR